MKSDEGLFWKSNWQLTFWNLRFGLVRFLNEQGEYFGKKICLLTCAVAKFFQLLNLWTKSHRGAIHKKTSQAELPCETIWVTVVYNREWNISWILAWVILRRWKGNERPRKIELIPVTLCTSTLYLVKSKLACFCLRTNKVRWWVFSSWSLLTRTKCISSWRYCAGWSWEWSYDTHTTFDMRSKAT